MNGAHFLHGMFLRHIFFMECIWGIFSSWNMVLEQIFLGNNFWAHFFFSWNSFGAHIFVRNGFEALIFFLEWFWGIFPSWNGFGAHIFSWNNYGAYFHGMQGFPFEKKLQSTLTKLAETNGCDSSHKERKRRNLLGGSRGMIPRKILKILLLVDHSGAFWTFKSHDFKMMKYWL